MKYIVFYCENSTPKVKYFKTEKSVNRFVDKFLKVNPDDRYGYWVDAVIYGKVVKKFPGWFGM